MTRPRFRKTTERFLRGLYPPTCVLCGTRGEGGLDLCAPCLADLPRNRHCCRRCALPLPAGLPPGALCGECQRRLPPYAVCHTAFRYEGPLPILVGGAKFRARLNLARLLGQCLANALRECGAELPELIVPVPLHAKRLRERGYNQSLELARTIGRAFSIPVDIQSCARVSATPPQAGLARKARRPNVRGAFRVLHPPGVERVAILDDVVTTGRHRLGADQDTAEGRRRARGCLGGGTYPLIFAGWLRDGNYLLRKIMNRPPWPDCILPFAPSRLEKETNAGFTARQVPAPDRL